MSGTGARERAKKLVDAGLHWQTKPSQIYDIEREIIAAERQMAEEIVAFVESHEYMVFPSNLADAIRRRFLPEGGGE